MENYTDSIKSDERRNIEKFFGPIKSSSANMFRFHSVPERYEGNKIIVLTNNVTFIKEKPVFMVTKNQGLYLQEWQYKKVESKRYGLKCYAVILNREHFKLYTFNSTNDKFAYIEDGDKYDSWLELAYEQEERHYVIKCGWKDEE